MKKIYILSAFLVIAGTAFGQYATLGDITKISRTTNYGTARSMAMGGAFGALGGDISSYSSNPAGIGVFRKSEISITPSFTMANTKANGRSTQNSSFQMGDFGAVFTFYSPSFDWRGFNFGVNYTNLNNFNRKTNQFVNNSTSSFLNVLSRNSLYVDPNELFSGVYMNTIEGLAYQTYLTNDTVVNGKIHYNPIYGNGVNPLQRKFIKEEGYQGEYAISFGTNFKDKLYLGMTVGIQDLHYKMKSIYTEASTETDLEYYNYNEWLKINGTGTNFKLGVIYRPIPELRIGIAGHTPTFYSISETFHNGMYSKFRTTGQSGKNSFSEETSPTSYDYDLKTPWKGVFSVAGVLMQKGIISVDYEYQDYSTVKLSNGEDGEDFYNKGAYVGMNDIIKTYLKSSHNIRVGAEYRANSTFSLRGGYNLQTSLALSGDEELDYNVQSVSAGFGLNFGAFYVDAAYMNKFFKNTTRFYYHIDDDDEMYDAIAQPVKNKYSSHEARLTLGVRF